MATARLENTNLVFNNGGTDLVKVAGFGNELNFTGIGGSATVLLTNVTDPSSAQDVATKAYVDSNKNTISWKQPVRARSAVNADFAIGFQAGAVIDGVTLAQDDRILISGQTLGVQNGLYIVNATGPPTRTDDMAFGSSAGGAAVVVMEGTSDADTAWLCTNDPPTDNVGGDPLTFVSFGAATFPGGVTTNIQYNLNDSFAGLSTFTTDNTNLSLTGADFNLATGDMVVTGGNVNLGDSDLIQLGSGTPVSIQYDGTNMLIASGSGNVVTTMTGTGQIENVLGTTDATSSFAIQDSGLTQVMAVNGAGDLTATGDATFTSTTVSSSSVTGAVVISGGLGVATDSYFGGEVTGVSFNATSDATLKQDIETISSPLEKLKSIDAVQYRFNFIEDDHLRYGVLAQQLEGAGFGDMVKVGHNGSRQVDYNNLVGLLIGAVKDLSEEVSQLKMV